MTLEELKSERERRTSLNELRAERERRSTGLEIGVSDISPQEQIAGAQQVASVPPRPPETEMQKMLRMNAEELNPAEAALIGAGSGLANVGRGVGLMDMADDTDKAAMEALKGAHPIAATGGEIVGEAAPFAPLALGAGSVGAAGGLARTLAGAGAGALEGATIARGTGGDVVTGAALGGLLGGASEKLMPAISNAIKSTNAKLGEDAIHKGDFDSIFAKRARANSLVNPDGTPTPSFASALRDQGLSFDELSIDAKKYIAEQQQVSPEQALKVAEYGDLGVDLTQGELTKNFEQQATEQGLLGAVGDSAAEPLRQFKLRQSEQIKTMLAGGLDPNLAENARRGAITEESGQAITDALINRESVLRTEKNDLYKMATEAAADKGDVPVFSQSIRDALPDADELEDMAITIDDAAMGDLTKFLTRYGVIDPTEQMIKSGVEVKPITLKNFETFRKGLNAIARRDTSGLMKGLTGKLKGALDQELDTLAESAEGALSRDILVPLKEARSRVREMKSEFSPKSLVGSLTDLKNDFVTPVTEASKVYDKMTGKGQSVEQVRKVASSLMKAGDKGETGLRALQDTVLLDVLNAGFGTQSRTVDGVRLFNPTAAINRIKTIGHGKLKAMLIDSPETYNRLVNLEKIARDLVPTDRSVPKGSADVNRQLIDKVIGASLAAKLPLIGGIIAERGKAAADDMATRKFVSSAINATPESTAKAKNLLQSQFPSIFSALAIPSALEYTDENTTTK